MTEQAQAQTFWEENNLPAPGTAMDAAAFDALSETTTRIELINGVVFYPNFDEETMSPGPRSVHQRSLLRLVKCIETAQPEGDLLTSPMDVWLNPETRVQPDIFWIAPDGKCTDHDAYFSGPPDLIVEVLSPSTARHDKTTKFLLYEQHGVREYWIVNADRAQVEVWVLREGVYALVGTFGAGESFVSPVLGEKTVELTGVFKD